MYIYLNGQVILGDQAVIYPTDRGFTLGDGIFETVYYDGQDFECLKPHYDRFMKGLTLFQIPVDWVISEFKAVLMQMIEANDLVGCPAAVRVTCTRGIADRGIRPPSDPCPTVLITTSAYHRQSKVIRIGVSQYSHAQTSILSGIKHLGYQLSVLGALEAKDRGLDDVLFFNAQGYLVGATSANIFIIKDGVMVTPPLTDGALPGVMRGKIIQEMQKSQVPVKIDHITRHDLESANRILLSNSLIGVLEAVLE